MSTVPKFGSFKPKVAHTSEEANAGGAALLPERKGQRVDASSHSQSSRRAHHSRHDDDVPDSHRSKQQSRKVEADSPRAATVRQDAEESKVFFVDRRGDHKNVEYGSLHRYSVPAYHRCGYEHLIGAPANVKIDRDSSTQQSAVLSLSDQRGSRIHRPLFSGRSWPQQESKLRLVHAPPTRDVIETQSDFIALRSVLKRRRSCSPSEQKAAIDVDYRSIDGKAKPAGPLADEDLEYASDYDLNDLVAEQALHARHANVELVKATKEHPNNADVWLALIEHQAKIIYPAREATSLTSAEKRNLADVHLSLYDRALKQVTADKPGHNDLVLGFLREGGLVWEHSKRASKWVEALKQWPRSVSLWTKYLDHVQTDHSEFTWEKCKAVYMKCLSLLRAACSTAAVEDRHRLVETQIYVFLRLTAFVKDAGYDELAYALWQLVLEKTFFKPATHFGPTGILDALQEFWESEVPRIGEKDAKGWAHQAGHDDTAMRQEIPANSRQLDVAQSMASLAHVERDMLNSLHLPATNDNDSADPFRHVMFSDVQDILETLVDEFPHQTLLNAFLVFVGWPTVPSHGNASSEVAWGADQYLRTKDLTHHLSSWTPSVMANERHTTFSLFDRAFEAVHDRVNETKHPSRDLVEFVNRVLERIVTALPQDDATAEYYIAQQLRLFTHDTVRTAKRLLKARPSSLRLYNAYALANAQQKDKVGKADEAWAMAIKMGRSLGEDVADDMILLWHSWIATRLQQDHAADALRLLLCMVDNNLDFKNAGQQTLTATASERLKTVRYLENGWEQMIYKYKYRHAVLFAECHMWFDYLVGGLALDAAIAVIAKYDTRLARREAPLAEELLLQAQAGVCKAHVHRHRPYRPVLVQHEAARCIRRFPQNSVFLELYALIQPHFQIEDRVRATLRGQMLGSSEATIISWSHAIVQESHRCTAEASGSMGHSVRSLFARALLEPSSTVSHSLTLWQMWLRFEQSQGHDLTQPPRPRTEPERKQGLQRNKQVFLDGLRHLPWSKAWVVMGLQAFACGGGMHIREMQQIHDVLAERELRVRVDMV